MERISYSPETLFHVLTHFETADEALRAGKNVFYIVGIAHVLGEDGINIAAQALGTEGEIGYVVTDVAQRPDQRALDQLASIEGTIRMRVIS